ncbi:MAG: hypothetical protein HYT22_02695 [Candidatus Niyogibacteria bacterium]|nr:hypothetical protein [Candidatus Niyogibacteria bacterium]
MSGLSSSDLESLRNELNARIASETNLLRALIAERSDSNFRAIALTNKIDHLSGITLSSITVSSVSGLTDADIPNDITIASSAGLSATSGSFSSTFGVTGLSTLTGGFLSQASSTVAANLSIQGPLSASSSVSIAGAAELLSTLSVSNLSTFTGGFISNASSSISSSLNVSGNLNASSTLFVGGTGTSSIAYGLTVGTSGGLVGIGTTAPGDHLAIEGSGTQALSIYSTDTGSGNVQKTFIRLYGENVAGTKVEQVRLSSAPGTANSSAGRFIVSVSGSSGITERMRIDENGNIGIGTTSPYAKLSIHANATETNRNLFSIASSTALATTTHFAITNIGNVGIGTSDPAQKLHVFNTASTPQFRIGYDKDFFADFQVDAGGDLLLNPSATSSPFTNSVRIMNDNLFICSNGACPSPDTGAGMIADTGNLIVENRVGIGTSTPNWALQLAGTRPFLTLSDTSAGTDLKHWFFSSQGGNLYVGTTTDGYATNTISALAITNAGNVLIGTTTNPSAGAVGLSVEGQIAAMGHPIPFSSVRMITTTGTTTFTAPEGVRRLWVEVYGGGGAGNCAATGVPPGGGGGGTVMGFVSSSTFPVFVGDRTATTSCTANGANGNYSQIGNPVIFGANGGSGGANNGSGLGGTIRVSGDINKEGESGDGGVAASYGGQGGSTFRGTGGTSNNGANSFGRDCGGGGAGSVTSVAGRGGAGCVVIWY